MVLLCCEQLLRNDGHKRHLGLVLIAAVSAAVDPSMDTLVAAAEVADGLGRTRSRSRAVNQENNLQPWLPFFEAVRDLGDRRKGQGMRVKASIDGRGRHGAPQRWAMGP